MPYNFATSSAEFFNNSTIFPFMALGVLGGAAIFLLVLLVAALYVYVSLCLYRIAKKLSVEPAWLAWIPIANIFLMLKMADKSYWWFILLLIPVVNIATIVVVWVVIAEKFGKPDWFAILMVISIVNLVALGYLAFSSEVRPVVKEPVI